MCSLCGILGTGDHWADAQARPGVFTRNTGSVERRRERARRVVLANRILNAFSLILSDWQGSTFVLATRTGRTEMVGDLAHLWTVAERVIGRPCDPLDPKLLDRLDGPGG